jgi:hypothetical protein
MVKTACRQTLVMGKSIIELVDELPEDNLTVKVLNALDFVVPGEWESIAGFDNMIAAVTKTRINKEKKIAKIRDRAAELYEDKRNGYQTAIWIYQTIDNTDKAIAAAAIADKVGDTFRFIPFLDKLTPKADTVQSLDLKMKLVAELIAYSKMNEITLNPVKFAQNISQHYRNEALMRMVALVCIDGIIPLGPDFITKIEADSNEAESQILNNNPALQGITEFIPDDNPQNFLNSTFKAVEGWMDSLRNSTGINRDVLMDKLSGFMEIADDKLDYVAAFLDASVNYFEHTGIQTVARHVINEAYKDFREDH